MKYEFDWTDFTPKDLLLANTEKGLNDDDIYGKIFITTDSGRYIADIHYENYSYDQRGFDLELYHSNDDGWVHTKWLTSIKSIHSATNYNRFCKRAEKLIMAFINATQT